MSTGSPPVHTSTSSEGRNAPSRFRGRNAPSRPSAPSRCADSTSTGSPPIRTSKSSGASDAIGSPSSPRTRTSIRTRETSTRSITTGCCWAASPTAAENSIAAAHEPRRPPFPLTGHGGRGSRATSRCVRASRHRGRTRSVDFMPTTTQLKPQSRERVAPTRPSGRPSFSCPRSARLVTLSHNHRALAPPDPGPIRRDPPDGAVAPPV